MAADESSRGLYSQPVAASVLSLDSVPAPYVCRSVLLLASVCIFLINYGLLQAARAGPRVLLHPRGQLKGEADWLSRPREPEEASGHAISCGGCG